MPCQAGRLAKHAGAVLERAPRRGRRGRPPVQGVPGAACAAPGPGAAQRAAAATRPRVRVCARGLLAEADRPAEQAEEG